MIEPHWEGTRGNPNSHWQYHCSDGIHDSIWKVLVTSKHWEEWYEHAEENMFYDVDETQELGMMSPQHFEDFINYIKTNE